MEEKKTKIETNYHDSEKVVKKIRDLEDSDVEAMNSVLAVISSTYNKKTKRRRFNLRVHILPNIIIDDVPLTNAKFNIICKTNGIETKPEEDLKDTKIKCKIRFVWGVTQDGDVYHSYQIFPVPDNMYLVARRTFFESFFVDQTRYTEFLINDMLARITFYKASVDESEPINLQSLSYE